MKKTALLFAAMAIMSMSAVSCSSSNSANKTEEENAENVEVKQPAVIDVTTDGVVDLANDDMYRPDSKVTKLTILDFNATWCVPCKKLAPAFDKAAEDFAGKVNFYSVDIEKNPQTANAFKVQNVPTVVFLTPNGEVQTYVGLGPFLDQENVKGDDVTEAILANITGKIEALTK